MVVQDVYFFVPCGLILGNSFCNFTILYKFQQTYYGTLTDRSMWDDLVIWIWDNSKLLI